MSGGPLHVWNKWAIQILVLLSFGLQILLFILASTRRHRSSTWLRICLRLILWLAYLMADTTAVYALGHLSISGWLPEHELVAFWAPFLLLHLGSQDNITAYALEDNQLWPRHLLTLGVQAFGVCYVLYKHMTHEPAMVIAASLMFMVGFLKYLERTWALKRATLDNIRSSIKAQPATTSLPVGWLYERTPWHYGCAPDNEDFLLFAHCVLPTCMAALTDFSVDSGKVSEHWKGEQIGKVVEMELSLMYDILYTKATMIHHWYGYILRVVSLLAIIVALLMFQSSGKDGHAKIDVIITYILFGGALFLDVVSLVKAAMSTWTCDLLVDIGGWGETLSIVIVSFRWFVRAASYRGWSGSVGQYNLFDACSRDMTKTSNRVLQMIKLDDWWKKYHYKGTLVIPRDFREHLYGNIWSQLKDNSDLLGLFDVKTRAGNFQLQEVIFVWHITTNIFIQANDVLRHPSVGAVKALSDYMMFLAIARHDMLPVLKLRSMCEQVSDALQQTWSEATPEVRRTGFGGILAQRVGEYIVGEHRTYQSHSTVDYGTLFAQELQLGIASHSGSIQMEMEERCRNMFGHILPNFNERRASRPRLTLGTVLALILDAWVCILVAASTKCGRESHARQLSHGGELITIVWIMTEHFGRSQAR